MHDWIKANFEPVLSSANFHHPSIVVAQTNSDQARKSGDVAPNKEAEWG